MKAITMKEARRHQVLIKRMEFKVAKVGRSRVTFYKAVNKGSKIRPTGSWMSRKDFRMLSRDRAFTVTKEYRGVQLKKGWVKPRITYKPLKVKCHMKVDGKFRKKVVSFKVASNTQRKYIYGRLQKNRIPVNDWRTKQEKVTVNMEKPVKEVDVQQWSHTPSPD